jgi:HrpA-like RNA helicase
MQVRYDRAVGSATAIKFMTDGILMREVQDDFLLRKYSVIVIDEAHERSLNTDLLLGMPHTKSYIYSHFCSLRIACAKPKTSAHT